ncbi:protein PIN-LIKES 2-like [Herrania umbratica]|uniref:Protein PIN-LIKES 2-like n=1 Tax=Herrania umbratica TaxID=108875 RepID=A0A6J1BBK2_9ROSI|nr:protein PIN-LIKES 2-like [Herrania umbratica]XP_021296624.1 protein PIN-LIKES 2-like [Herrania umbratica]XP_021296625.1 protein PIN-LIKES 2-like [Herrania umbratica]
MMEPLLAILNRDLKSTECVVQAVLPVLKLLSIALIGLLLSHPKIQMIPRPTLKLLSKLIFVLFWPCLIFTHLGPVISVKKFSQWWFIPVNVVISTAIGCILGLLVALICRPPPEFFRFTVIMTAFGNTGNIPLAVVSSVCHNEDNPFGDTCYDGIAYASFSQWVSVVLVYTLVYHMMEPPMEFYAVVEEGSTEIEELPRNDISTPLLIEAEWAGIEDRETEHCKTPFIARLFHSHSGVSQSDIPDVETTQEESPSGTKSNRCLAEPNVVKKIRIVAERTPIHHILQPPLVATILAILLGIIPQVKPIVFGSDAPLDFITDSMAMISEATVPAVMLVLGGMLREGPNESRLGIRTTIGIIVARLLILPLAGIGVIYLADRWNFLISDNSLYRFVLLLQYTTPSAILLGAMASLRGYAVREASALLFWQHVFALLSLSLYLYVYLKLLVSFL